MSRPKSAAAIAGRKRRQSGGSDDEQSDGSRDRDNSENNDSENESGSGSGSDDGGDESAGYTEGEEDDEGNKKPKRRRKQQGKQHKDHNQTAAAVASTSAGAGAGATAAAASSNKGKNAGEKGGADQTDIHALDDAVGISGVDLNAEEEAIRATNLKPRNAQQQAAAKAKAKPQLILDEQALRDAVLRIAASFQLRNLESDTLPLIGLAVQMRMRRLIEAMIAAKEHRVTSNHQRPPPMFPPLGDPNELPAPMWDQVMYDDVEKIMGTIDRVEREEERQARKDRLRRDQAEQEERERLERLAQEGGEDSAVVNGEGGAASGDVSMAEASGSGSMPGTPLGGSFDKLGKSIQGGTGTGKGEKKRKRETPAQTARNMSDDVRKKLSDQTALRNLGTKKRYSWMGGGPADSPLLKKNLPKPKFPPLPPSSMRVTTNADDEDTSMDDSKSKVKGEGTDADAPLTSNPPSALARLTAVPSAHSASKTTSFGGNSMLEDPGNQYVTIRDAIFVLENERGKGAGIGSGTKALYKAHMGRV